MKLIINNKQYELDFQYPDDDVTIGEVRVAQPSQPRETWPVIAYVKKARYYLDKPVSKAKRRTYAVKALLNKMRLDRTARTGAWEQLWQQMRVPS